MRFADIYRASNRVLDSGGHFRYLAAGMGLFLSKDGLRARAIVLAIVVLPVGHAVAANTGDGPRQRPGDARKTTCRRIEGRNIKRVLSPQWLMHKVFGQRPITKSSRAATKKPPTPETQLTDYLAAHPQLVSPVAKMVGVTLAADLPRRRFLAALSRAVLSTCVPGGETLVSRSPIVIPVGPATGLVSGEVRSELARAGRLLRSHAFAGPGGETWHPQTLDDLAVLLSTTPAAAERYEMFQQKKLLAHSLPKLFNKELWARGKPEMYSPAVQQATNKALQSSEPSSLIGRSSMFMGVESVISDWVAHADFSSGNALAQLDTQLPHLFGNTSAVPLTGHTRVVFNEAVRDFEQPMINHAAMQSAAKKELDRRAEAERASKKQLTLYPATLGWVTE